METLKLDSANFDSVVNSGSQPVLIDFYADWCGPCRKQLPIMDEIAKDYTGKAKIGKVNVDETASKATEFGVSSIPALLVFKDGKMVERMVGLHSKNQLSEILDKYL